MSKINAVVVADSTNQQGDRLISLVVTFPRIILAELNTHRMLSKNSASSRAIPFKKMVEMVKTNSFVPIAWQKEHKGMQGTEYHIEHPTGYNFKDEWLRARDCAIKAATFMNDNGLTKQLCNRLLEPFMWHTVLITGNVNNEAWLNFFKLRCPQYKIKSDLFDKTYKSRKEAVLDGLTHYKNISVDNLTDLDWLQMNSGLAEIHMMQLAECIYDAINESEPKKLKAGEWHIPFGDKIRIKPNDGVDLNFPTDMHDFEVDDLHEQFDDDSREEFNSWIQPIRIKISTAMAARTSYTVIGDEKEVSYDKLIQIHDGLIIQDPLHASPMEHCARVMTQTEWEGSLRGSCIINGDDGLEILPSMQGWCRNYKGFIQYRHILETK